MSDTKVYKDFLSGTVGEKSVREVPGIGSVLAGKLKNNGFHKAYQVIGHYLEIGKNELEFKNWLHTTIGANENQQKMCFDAVNQYVKAFF